MISKARVEDAENIKSLIDYYSGKGLLLPKSLSEIYEHIRDFFVFRERNRVIGCAALHIIWKDLAEIKSVAVSPRHRKKGVGNLLVGKCVREAKSIGISKIFVLTYICKFFEKQGFKKISKNSLPKKIWGACVKCVKFPNCDETAMMVEIK